MRKKTVKRTLFERNEAICMACVCAISLLAIAGWLFNLPILASLRPEYIPMAPASALIFLGLGAVWLIQRNFSDRRWIRNLTQVGLLGLLIIVIILALRYFTGLGPDLEKILYPNPPVFAQFSSARMSPLTALGFLLAIPVLLLLTGVKPDIRRKSAAAGMALVLLLLCSVNLLGYLYGAPLFYGGATIPMAFTSALSFVFLSLGLLMMAGPDCWPVSLYADPSLKARLLRTFIPASLLIVLLQGLLNTVANPWALNPAIKVAFAALLACLIVIIIISFIANALSADIERGRKAQLQSEFLFRALFESSPDSVMLIDPKDPKISWPIIDCNTTGCRMNGYTRDELIGQSIDIVNLTQGTPAERIAYLEELRKAGNLQLETFHRHKNGTIFPIEVSTTLIHVGERELVMGIDRDITERKQAEETLTKTENIYRQAITRAGGVPYQLDYGNESYVFLGEGFESLTGYLPSEMTGPLFTSRLRQVESFGEYKDLSHEQYIRLARQGGVNEWREDLLFERKDGRLVWLADHSVQLKDAAGKMVGALGILMDISERKRVEAALRESEERFSRLSVVTSEGIGISDQGRLIDANPQLAKMLGYDLNELIGFSAIDFVAPESRDLVMEHMRAGFEGPYEHLALKKDGSIFPVEIRARIIPYKGRQTRATIIRDITDRKQTQTLQEAVYRIATAAEITTSLDDLYPQIHQIISSVMPAENFYITLYDEAQNLLRFPYFKDSADQPFVGGIQPGKGLTAYVLRTGQSLLCTQAVHDELERQGEIKLLGVPSAIWLGVPLIVEGRTIGVMVVQHYTDPKAYGEREQHMLEFVSTLVAKAIDRKRAEVALVQSEAELRALFASMNDVVLVIDRAGLYCKIAPTNPDLLIKSPDELLGKTLRDVFPPEQAKEFLRALRQVLKTKQTAQIEYDLIIGDRTVQFETSISPMTEDRTLWVAHDITKRKRFELVEDAIFRITQAAITDEGIEELYRSIHSILGELIPTENFFIALYDPVAEMISFPYYVDQYDEQPTQQTKIQGLTGYVLRTGRPLLATRELLDRLVQQGEVELVGTAGVDWMGAPLKVHGRMIGVMAVQSYEQRVHFNQEDLNLFEFVSSQVAQAIERKRMEEEIRNLSFTDELTGLYNRRGFTLLAEQEMKLARRFKRGVLLFFADVDDLKTINDTHGHAQGDLALREMSAILKETFREADIPARYGGDEFVVLAVDVTMASADLLTNRLQAALVRHNQKDGRLYQLGLSLGIASFDPQTDSTLNELIALADSQMYAQKHAGKEKQ